MKLTELFAGVDLHLDSGKAFKGDIEGVANDSRKVKPNDVFVALPGTGTDGSKYIAQAVQAGAVVVVAEKSIECSVPLYVTPSASKALALIAANFYKHPAKELSLLAVTGTNGKTTTTHLLESICAAGGGNTGIIGTIHYRFAGDTYEATHTTPDALELHRMFRKMVDAGTDTVIMEVSSHALAQDRVHGLTFRAACFTNLSRDHLDYHKDMEDYFQAKRRLFSENLSAGGLAVVNGDDTYASRIYSELRNQKRMSWKFSAAGNGELSVANVELSIQGIKATLKTPAGDIPVKSTLLGAHNLDNILAAAGTALGAGFSRRDVQDGVERVKTVAGRLERVGPENSEIAVLVDYAHTDDALRRTLESVRKLSRGRVLAVFGTGGDRDKGKRPLMGQAAAELADLSMVTSDNPRSEDPDEIIAQITPGLEKGGMRRISAGKAKSGEKGYLVDADRKSAIAAAIALAKPGDVVVVAGRGCEKFQKVGDERVPFDDRLVAAEALTHVLKGL